MLGFPDDCVAEDRSVAWLLAAREYPWLRSHETSAHILPSEILRIVHRKLVGPDTDVFMLTELLKMSSPEDAHSARRIAISALSLSKGSCPAAFLFITRTFNTAEEEEESEDEEEEEDDEGEAMPQQRCVRCRGLQPCHHCRRCVDCAFDDVFDPACLYCALNG